MRVQLIIIGAHTYRQLGPTDVEHRLTKKNSRPKVVIMMDSFLSLMMRHHTGVNTVTNTRTAPVGASL